MVYLGLQEDTRKRRPNYQMPGEWIGYITLLLKNVGLFITVYKRKWGRAKEIICDLLSKFNNP